MCIKHGKPQIGKEDHQRCMISDLPTAQLLRIDALVNQPWRRCNQRQQPCKTKSWRGKPPVNHESGVIRFGSTNLNWDASYYAPATSAQAL